MSLELETKSVKHHDGKISVGRCGVGVRIDCFDYSTLREKGLTDGEIALHKIFGNDHIIFMTPDEARQVANELLKQADAWEEEASQK